MGHRPTAEMASDGCAAGCPGSAGLRIRLMAEVRRVVGAGSPNILDT
jgi:hypothetical protein